MLRILAGLSLVFVSASARAGASDLSGTLATPTTHTAQSESESIGEGAVEAQRPRLTSEAAWIEAVQHQSRLYFPEASPPRLEVYDMASETWAAPIKFGSLTAYPTPTAVAVDDLGLYVAFGTKIYRCNQDGSSPVYLKDAAVTITRMFLYKGYLYATCPSGWFTLDRYKGTLIAGGKFRLTDAVGISLARVKSKAFACSSGVTPIEVLSMPLGADGSYGKSNSTPHGDDYMRSRTWVFPDETRVADDAGIVYNTDDLSYAGSLGGHFQDVAFIGGAPVLLRENHLDKLTTSCTPIGSAVLGSTPSRVFSWNEKLFAFEEAPTHPAVEIVRGDDFEEDQAAVPVDPEGLRFLPDSAVQTSDGTICVLSREHLAIYRWSPAIREYRTPIGLTSTPDYMAYSSAHNCLLLAYPTGLISSVSLSSPTQETPLAYLVEKPNGLASAGEYVFASDPSGAWDRHYTFSMDGRLISNVDWNHYSNQFVWNPTTERMYFFRDDTVPNDILWEEIGPDGKLGNEADSPYHGDFVFNHPIVLSPDGQSAMIATGKIFDASTLQLTGSLTYGYTDAAWFKGTLYSIRNSILDSQITRWSPSFAVEDRLDLPGQPLRIFGGGEQMVVLTSNNGYLQFVLVNPDLTFTATPVPTPTPTLTPTPAPTPMPTPTPAPGPVEKILIIAGGGEYASNQIQAQTRQLAAKAYRLSRNRGIPASQILLLDAFSGIDADGDGHDEPQLPATLANLLDALDPAAGWAANADPLIIYMVDHGSFSGSEYYFQLDPANLLSAGAFNGALNALQSVHPQMRVVVVADFCYSGSYLLRCKPSAGRVRALLAGNTGDGDVNFSGPSANVSFSDFFFNDLMWGGNLKHAFQLARNNVQSLILVNGVPIQVPWMDDNGDGKSNKDDGQIVETINWGNPFASGAIPPRIVRATTGGLNRLTLSAEVGAEADVARVWANLIPEDFRIEPGKPVTNIMQVALIPVAGTQRTEWEVAWPDWLPGGAYRVVLFAQSDTGTPTRELTSEPVGMLVDAPGPRNAVAARSWTLYP